MHALTMKELQRFEVPARSLAVWWLGQMSFILKSPAGKIVAIDPYLSNSCRQAAMEGGFDMDRQTPPPMAASDLVGIDLYLLTHSHQDHLDPDTLRPYLQAGGRGPFVSACRDRRKTLPPRRACQRYRDDLAQSLHTGGRSDDPSHVCHSL